MFKHKTKDDLRKELEKMENKQGRLLNYAKFQEEKICSKNSPNKIINDDLFKLHKAVQKVLNQSLRKENKLREKIENYDEKMEARKYCPEERKARTTLLSKPEKYPKPEQGICSSSPWSERKQVYNWNEKMKNQSNQEVGCSHWEKRANQTPFTSPFK